MTEKRFRVFKYNDSVNYGVSDDFAEYTVAYFDNHFEAEHLCDLLNELNDENEQLKQAYTQLKHRHSLLHDVCIDAECDRDSLKKDVESLEKENEQLKHSIKCLEADKMELQQYIKRMQDGDVE